MPSAAARCPQARAQVLVIDGAHVGEAGAEARVVGTGERVAGQHVDVVGDQHQAPRAGLTPQAAGGVGEQQRFAAEQLERAYGRRHDLDAGALVGMGPALETGDRRATELAEQQPAGVALDARPGKAGQVGVVDSGRAAEPRRDIAAARAENQADLWGHVADPRPDRARGLVRRAAHGAGSARFSGPKA